MSYPDRSFGPHSIQLGSVIQDRYRITAFIGEGGFAQVYRGQDLEIERDVAVKVFQPLVTVRDSVERELAMDRFRMEARTAAKIRHPNVVTIHDIGVTDRLLQPYIVMELLDGYDMEKFLKRYGPMDPARALPLICECLEALGEGHQAGIVHKDLKPSNLFLTEPNSRRESLRIVDFGIARLGKDKGRGRITGTGQILGTPQYYAPEYVRRQLVTPALDVYQMGLILVEILSGIKVVDSDDPYICLNRHCEGDLDIPRSLLDSPLGTVLKRALAVDERERYQDAHAFCDALTWVNPRKIPSMARRGDELGARPSFTRELDDPKDLLRAVPRRFEDPMDARAPKKGTFRLDDPYRDAERRRSLRDHDRDIPIDDRPLRRRGRTFRLAFERDEERRRAGRGARSQRLRRYEDDLDWREDRGTHMRRKSETRRQHLRRVHEEDDSFDEFRDRPRGRSRLRDEIEEPPVIRHREAPEYDAVDREEEPIPAPKPKKKRKSKKRKKKRAPKRPTPQPVVYEEDVVEAEEERWDPYDAEFDDDGPATAALQVPASPRKRRPAEPVTAALDPPPRRRARPAPSPDLESSTLNLDIKPKKSARRAPVQSSSTVPLDAPTSSLTAPLAVGDVDDIVEEDEITINLGRPKRSSSRSRAQSSSSQTITLAVDPNAEPSTLALNRDDLSPAICGEVLVRLPEEERDTSGSTTIALKLPTPEPPRPKPAPEPIAIPEPEPEPLVPVETPDPDPFLLSNTRSGYTAPVDIGPKTVEVSQTPPEPVAPPRDEPKRRTGLLLVAILLLCLLLGGSIWMFAFSHTSSTSEAAPALAAQSSSQDNDAHQPSRTVAMAPAPNDTATDSGGSRFVLPNPNPSSALKAFERPQDLKKSPSSAQPEDDTTPSSPERLYPDYGPTLPKGAIKVRVRTSPEDAEIFHDNGTLGQGPVTLVLVPDKRDRIRLRIEREGFLRKIITVRPKHAPDLILELKDPSAVEFVPPTPSPEKKAVPKDTSKKGLLIAH